MRAALGVLTSLSCTGRRIAVLSDMLELGENELLYHRQVGEFAGGLDIDQLVCVGSRAKEYGAGATAKNPALNVRCFSCNEDAAGYLRAVVSAGDLLLFKGSNSTRVGQIITLLKEECE